MAVTYEEQRLQNIRDNEALLLSLGLSTPSLPKKVSAPKPKPKPKTPNSDNSNLRKSAIERKRKRELSNETSGVDTPGRSLTDTESDVSSTRRRSGRISARPTPDYKSSGLRESPYLTPTKKSRVKKEEEESDEEYEGGKRNGAQGDGRLRNAQKLGLRTQDPKTFGHIPGVEVGKWWATRMDASTDAVHAPTVAGISGNAVDGAWSVALSGGYADDIDLGYAFTYTGCGGRDLKGTKQNPKNLRTAPQTSHQSFHNALNAALKTSAETRNPVRVIRGFKLQSPYAPATGYRYDGLYIVEKAWMGKGLTKGLMVCRYAFKRVDGQSPLPERDLEAEAREAEEEEG
ncbi:hypothetical protein CI109_105155 [Kwoniella shandongensis]|uniref:Uncharacterized protein n=1 Tax=Kwoniella shandongensis TaxID=1734106 RepID=A0A5M6C8P4_9TREE|nr:uncharacterized protein CI109_001994 [Kwoniella shandongensis]KAA5529569.1 hypothetical protein CI109_001994 [Kwoniella shandongensis]